MRLGEDVEMRVGIQLYSVRNRMAEDPVAAVKAVVREGYRYLETANHSADKDPGVGFGVPAKEMKEILDGEGARIVSAHIFPMTGVVLGPVLEYYRRLGAEYLVMPMGFYPDRDAALRQAEDLNRMGKICAEAGISLLYHNHFHEFQVFDGSTVFDLILGHTDPNLVKLELDTYWAMRGGEDPAALLRKWRERIRLIHQKDYPAEYRDQINLIDRVNREQLTVDMNYFMGLDTEKTFTEIGTGIMDIQGIIDAGNGSCKADYIILEQDNSSHDEFESVTISMEHFKKFTGIEW
jgi:sugar phosphate isomerase/epimerase